MNGALKARLGVRTLLKSLLTLLLAINLSTGVVRAQFADIPAGHYAEGSVLKLTQLGILSGFPDGLYRGEQSVNRFELALILSRMWDNWSTEQLGDVWSEIVSLEAQLAEVRGQSEGIRRHEAALMRLEADLTETQARLLALDDRTANVRLTRENVSALETELGTLEGNVRTLAAQLGGRERGGQAQSVVGRLQKAADTLARLERQFAEQNGRLAGTQSQLDTLLAVVNQFPRDLDAELGTLRGEFLAERKARAWDGDLTVAAGLLGNGPAYTLAAHLNTQHGRLNAVLNEYGLEAEASGRLLDGFELGGRYKRTDVGELGLASVELAATPALRFGVTGSSDQGLAFGGFVKHLGNQPGAALPGLDVLINVSSGLSGEGEFGRLLVQGSAGLTFVGGGYTVRPAVLYRRETGLENYQGFVGELGVGIGLGAELNVTAVGRYGLFTDLSGGPGRGTPEGKLRLDFGSGLNLEVEATAGLPNGASLGTFADGNPLLTDLLEVGVRVGYSVSLDEGP